MEIPQGSFYKEFEDKLVERTEAYRFSSLNKAKSSPNPWLFLTLIWTKMALPGILYGLEAGPVSIRCLNKLETIQSKVAKSILGLPMNTQNWVQYIALGLKPIWYHAHLATLKFFIKTFNKEGSTIGDNLKLELECLNSKSPLVARVKFILKNIEADINDDIETKLLDYTLEKINKLLTKHEKTSFLFNKLDDLSTSDPPLQHPKGLNSKQQKTFYSFVFLNTRLGNRNPLPDREQTKSCPLCKTYGVEVRLNEVHLLIECPDLEYVRQSTGLARIIQQGPMTAREKYKRLWRNNYEILSEITDGAETMKMEFYRRISFTMGNYY